MWRPRWHVSRERQQELRSLSDAELFALVRFAEPNELHDGELWVSYYASHEAKASIYLARVRL